MIRTAARIAATAGLLLLATVASVHAQPTFTKDFQPATIAVGNASELVFTISDEDGVPVTDLAFTDPLPAGVTITDPAFVTNGCGGLVDAPAGGSTISLAGGVLAPGASCTIRVAVESGVAGTHQNVTGDLTSSSGSSGPATADLVVDATRPTLTKTFAPDLIANGGNSVLAFTISNPTASLITNFVLTDPLPAGLVIASPSGLVTDCTGTITATPGTSTVSWLGGFLFAGTSCDISLRVQANAAGLFDNRTTPMSSTAGTSGFAIDRLRAVQEFLSKSFADDPVAPGGNVTLELTLVNFDRDFPVTDVTFTDDLDAALSGLVAVGLPANDVCGPGSQISGTSVLTLTGGNLPPEGSCTIQVTLQVPAGTAPGTYTNTTSQVTGVLDGSPVTGPAASDDLLVEPAPRLTKSFTDDPVDSGSLVTLEFTITNTSTDSTATGITFTDNLTALFPGITVDTLPAPGFCGPASTMLATTSVPPVGDLSLLVSNGELAPGASCTFQVVLQLPAGINAGSYLNVTSGITGTVGGETYTGDPATDELLVVAAPTLSKVFLDPVAPGAPVVLRFELTYTENAPAGATGIAFTDDLGAVLAGLTALGLPANDVCGVGSQISGTTLLSFSGGSLAPGESCTFEVTAQVPVGATPGSYPNTTSEVTAMSLGLPVTSPAASDDLDVVGLTFTKQFTDDPSVPGGTVTLEFTIANVSATQSATALAFTDNLSAVIAGLAAVGLPANDVCGPGSQISGTTLLVLSGGNLGPGASCTFPVTLQIPGGASAGEYTNQTSNLTGEVDGSPVVLPGAGDALLVVDALSITKEFTDDPAVAGGTVTLEFTISNGAAQPATGITFTDDLDAALSGLVAVGLPANDVCGPGSQISGTSLLTLTGGNLPGGGAGSCTFQVTLQVPAGVPPGTTALNTTSSVTGTVGGVSVTGAPASDLLRIEVVSFTKAFDGLSAAGGSPVLTFTITNFDATAGLAGLSFLDDLDAVLPGLVAVGLPASGVCGPGSTISGTSTLTFTGGSLGPGESCSFDVTLAVPAGTAPGTYPNTTSDLLAGGIQVAGPATADLGIEPPPTFAKSFNPDSIGVGGVATLTFVIDNTASAVAATGLDFTDVLPAGVIVADPAKGSTTCTGGTITAVPGSGTITYTGGSVAAGASCSVQASVTATAPGDHVNVSGDLTSSSGNSGTATDTLTANPQPGFAKSFAPDPIGPGAVSTLTFTIDNTGSTVAATALDFTDDLPAAITVASPANASTTCTGGTITAAPGSGTIAYTGGSIAAGASCTVQADVTATAPGTHVNVSGALTSSLGSSGTATDSLTVVRGVATLSKQFLSAPVLRGGLVELEFTVTNASPDFPLTAVSFSDDLGAALPGLVAIGLPANDVCGAGSQIAGTSVITLTGGTVPAAGSCTFSVTVLVPPNAPLGVYTNVTGVLTADASGVPVEAPPASDDFEVVFLEFAKEFDPSAVNAGEEVTLTFTIVNPDPVNAATAIAFDDDLEGVLPGLIAIGTPIADVCGPGSLLDGTSVLTLAGGSLPGGGSCTFSVTLAVPPATINGTFTNLTSPLTAEVAGAPVTGDPAGAAAADLSVTGTPLIIPTLQAPAMILLAAALALLAIALLRRRERLGSA